MEKIRPRHPGWKRFRSGILDKHLGSATLPHILKSHLGKAVVPVGMGLNPAAVAHVPKLQLTEN